MKELREEAHNVGLVLSERVELWSRSPVLQMGYEVCHVVGHSIGGGPFPPGDLLATALRETMMEVFL